MLKIKTENAKRLSNFLYKFDDVMKAERILSGSCRHCLQFDNTHIWGCEYSIPATRRTIIHTNRAK